MFANNISYLQRSMFVGSNYYRSGAQMWLRFVYIFTVNSFNLYYSYRAIHMLFMTKHQEIFGHEEIMVKRAILISINKCCLEV